MKGQKGYALSLALITLAVGTLVLVPFLQHAYIGITSSRISKELTIERYAADAAMQEAIWRLQANIDGITDSVTPDNPSVGYPATVNGVETLVTIDIPASPDPPPPPEPEPRFWWLEIVCDVDICWVKSSDPTTFTFTITIHNCGFLGMLILFVFDLLPPGFQYVPGSCTGLTSEDPTITYDDESGQQRLDWTLPGWPWSWVGTQEGRTLTFQATATLTTAGMYYNEAGSGGWPGDQGEIDTGPSAPVGVAVYELTVKAGRVTIRSTVAIDGTEATILSWQVE